MRIKQYKKPLCMLFVSCTILVVGSCSIIENGGITYETVMGALGKILPSAFILGLLGWLIGSMIESSSAHKADFGYTNTLLDELMKSSSEEDENAEISFELSNEEKNEEKNEPD